jgi:hypothetical protein
MGGLSEKGGPPAFLARSDPRLDDPSWSASRLAQPLGVNHPRKKFGFFTCLPAAKRKDTAFLGHDARDFSGPDGQLERGTRKAAAAAANGSGATSALSHRSKHAVPSWAAVLESG